MLYRKNPKTGDELSILGFGCMRLPQKDGRIDEERAMRQIRSAIDQGVNYIDTAWPYHFGDSEPFVGRALAGGYRERVRLATKLPAWLANSREEMDHFLNLQIERLATSQIDYYLIHSLSGDAWDRIAALGVADFLDKAKADGRIVRAGFSYHGTKQDFARIVDAYPWDFCQIQYNYLDTDQQAGTEGLRYAASKGLAVIVMEPLRGGALAGEAPPAVAELWNQASRKRTMAEWALRWIWNQPEVTVVLSGMNEEAQVEENLRIAGEALPNSLTAEELDLIERVSRKYQEVLRVGCTGCAYCQPCPSGVDIPGCFATYNALHTFGNKDAPFIYVLRSGGVQSGKPGYASQCGRCMDCIDKCPQDLEIPDLLELVAAEFESQGLHEREVAVRQFLCRR